MISTWDFAGADKLGPRGGGGRAPHRAPSSGAVPAPPCRRSTSTTTGAAGAPSSGSWWRTSRESETGAAIAGVAGAGADDYSVLKPKHSAFYATPLDLLAAPPAREPRAADRRRQRSVHRGERERRPDAGLRGDWSRARLRRCADRRRGIRTPCATSPSRKASRRRRPRASACLRRRRPARPVRFGAAERAVLRFGELPRVLARGEQLVAEALRGAIAARVAAAQEHAGFPARHRPRARRSGTAL